MDSVIVKNNMTEDDTFKKLKKPSYAEMKDIWMASEIFSGHGQCTTAELESFFSSYGWSVYEYSDLGKFL